MSPTTIGVLATAATLLVLIVAGIGWLLWWLTDQIRRWREANGR